MERPCCSRKIRNISLQDWTLQWHENWYLVLLPFIWFTSPSAHGWGTWQNWLQISPVAIASDESCVINSEGACWHWGSFGQKSIIGSLIRTWTSREVYDSSKVAFNSSEPVAIFNTSQVVRRLSLNLTKYVLPLPRECSWYHWAGYTTWKKNANEKWTIYSSESFVSFGPIKWSLKHEISNSSLAMKVCWKNEYFTLLWAALSGTIQMVVKSWILDFFLFKWSIDPTTA